MFSLTHPGFIDSGIFVQCNIQIFSTSSRVSLKIVQVFSNLVQSSNGNRFYFLWSNLEKIWTIFIENLDDLKITLDDTLDLYSKIGKTWTLTQTRPGFTDYGILVQCIVQVFSNSSRFSVKNVQVFSNLVQSSNVHVLPVP